MALLKVPLKAGSTTKGTSRKSYSRIRFCPFRGSVEELVREQDDPRGSFKQAPLRRASEPRVQTSGRGVIDGDAMPVFWRTVRAAVIGVAGVAGLALFSPEITLLAQAEDKPAIASETPTINLTQEQRFIIKENVKDLHLSRAPADTTDKIGDLVPQNIELQPMPPAVRDKVPQARSHLFFIKDDAIVLVDPKDRRVADVIH